MSDHRYYLSVMTPALASGSINIQLDTYDADYNVSVTSTVTGITAGQSEIDIAIALQTQLTPQVPAYSGAPRFSAEPYAATFRITRSEHVLCFWSQSQFRLQILDNPTTCALKESNVACLMTVEQARRMAVSYGTDFVTSQGAVLSDEALIDLIETVSDEVCAYLKNNVVISTYLGEWSAKDTKGIFTAPNPGLSIDDPLIRRKNLYEMYSIPQYSKLAYNWLRHSGKLTFRFNQNYVNAGEPFADDNEIRVTFVAGNWVIPSNIRRGLYMLMQLGLQLGPGAVEELAGGTFKVRFRKVPEQLDRILRPLKGYVQKKMK